MITGNGGTSYACLGRPWGPFGRVVYAHTYMDACIKPEGWDNWGKTENERSACFYEYRYQSLVLPPPNCSGPLLKTDWTSPTCCKLLLTFALIESDPASRGLSEFELYRVSYLEYSKIDLFFGFEFRFN